MLAKKIPGHFPKDTGRGVYPDHVTRSLPEIWKNWTEFEKQVQQFEAGSITAVAAAPVLVMQEQIVGRDATPNFRLHAFIDKGPNAVVLIPRGGGRLRRLERRQRAIGSAPVDPTVPHRQVGKILRRLGLCQQLAGEFRSGRRIPTRIRSVVDRAQPVVDAGERGMVLNLVAVDVLTVRSGLHPRLECLERTLGSVVFGR